LDDLEYCNNNVVVEQQAALIIKPRKPQITPESVECLMWAAIDFQPSPFFAGDACSKGSKVRASFGMVAATSRRTPQTSRHTSGLG
jgi:hypothetical protein